MNNQKKIVKLTKLSGSPILVGVESIIQIHEDILGVNKVFCTKIQSRGAMVETCWVTESVDEVWEIINN